MAKFLGIAGDFQKERALNRRLNLMLALYLLMAAAFFLLGFATAKFSIWWSLAGVVIVYPTFKFFERRWDRHLRMARLDETAAAGESSVIPFLKDLPDTCTVFSDLTFADSYGNIDHLVIGPTGIFSIDVKNWKGTVVSDGKGELLCNGKPTEKRHVRAFTARSMDLKDRLKVLTKLDPYIQCLFVFPHTHLDAKWGTTSSVHCIHAKQLVEYITQGKGGKPLPPADLPRLVSAVAALKDMVGTSQETPLDSQKDSSRQHRPQMEDAPR